ncbi:MAG: hypothetical protein EAZ42_04020 [Verrucomicrobia bacterium]|nr:MAG: hypothetical protein EAZ42_04020 [Verrucomicrobiota bacterium]
MLKTLHSRPNLNCEVTSLAFFDRLALSRSRIFSLVVCFAFCSCAAPKAIVLEEPKLKPKKPAVAAAVTPPVEQLAQTSSLPVNDGLRMPDLLKLPDEAEFRPSNIGPSDGPQAGAVISRPPTEPPSRVKPVDGAAPRNP